MHDSKISKNIISVSEFKSNASGWLRHLSTSRDPLIITLESKPAGVLLSPKTFKKLTQRLRFTKAVDEGLADAENGRVSSHKSVTLELKKRFGFQVDQ